jgi:hypothetical protein
VFWVFSTPTLAAPLFAPTHSSTYNFISLSHHVSIDPTVSLLVFCMIKLVDGIFDLNFSHISSLHIIDTTVHFFFTNFFQQKKIPSGAGESGKSTIFKQMRIIYQNGFSDKERREFIRTIQHNCMENMRELLMGAKKLGLTRLFDDQCRVR